jgi:hypothetical protein
MYDALRCGFFAGSITLFANVPQLFEWPLEKIGFGALLFFIIWTYMKQILPKTHEEMQKLREENRTLLDEIRKLNQLREQDQKLITSYLEELKQLAKPSSGQRPEKE